MLERKPIEINHPLIKERMDAAGLVINKGWDPALASGLVIHSLEPDIVRATPRDATERFSDISTAMEWNNNPEKARIVYSLFRAAELAGVIWFSKQSFEGADKTFAIRMYESARGMGFAKPFAQAVHYDHEVVSGYDGDTWLETGKENISARQLFPQLQYEEVESVDLLEHRIRMIRQGIASSMIHRTLRPH